MYKPTEEQAIKNMARRNAQMKTSLQVAKRAIELCLEELERR